VSAELYVVESEPTPNPADESWVDFLKARVRPDWRPGEFDPDRLLFLPDLDNPHTIITTCGRNGCTVRLSGGNLCPSCRAEWRLAKSSGMSQKEFMTTERARRQTVLGCMVEGCARSHAASALCRIHAGSFRAWRRRQGDRSLTASDWIAARKPEGLPAAPRCAAGSCSLDAALLNGLCTDHHTRFTRWQEAQGIDSDASVATWIERETEPFMDEGSESTYAEYTATPFLLLPEPVRWEFLYAVQQRDMAGRAALAAVAVRGLYNFFRRQAVTSLVGAERLGHPGAEANRTAMFAEYQRHIDDAYREWSGIDDRDPLLVRLVDLPLKDTTKKVGAAAAIDFRGFQQPWIVETVLHWARATPHSPQVVIQMVQAWAAVDDVITSRGTRREHLGLVDMDAVAQEVNTRWIGERTQQRHLTYIKRLCEYGRRTDDLQHVWGAISARFTLDPERHVPRGQTAQSASNPDEPFRFVPQPIIDWVMDHLNVLDRGDEYRTAEARLAVFLQERCGRRTGETVRLLDDCLSYDSTGAPYLEWVSVKPPYHKGKRLPIHQETHDAIKEWQAIKAAHGVTSQWLFPSSAFAQKDRHYDPGWLADRVRDLVTAVAADYPYPGTVEGADGNLIHFDITSIEPYSFRHAFAQRLADATDGEGRPTTPPDVL
jgi:integrase